MVLVLVVVVVAVRVVVVAQVVAVAVAVRRSGRSFSSRIVLRIGDIAVGSPCEMLRYSQVVHGFCVPLLLCAASFSKCQFCSQFNDAR